MLSVPLKNLFSAFAIALLVTGLFFNTARAQSVYAEHEFADPKQEVLFKQLAAELRCLVCQNQNIADSNAELAQDLRREITTMIKAGDNKDQIIDFMVARYGEFVLYRPLFSMKTAVLWIGPFVFFIFGLFIVSRMAKKRREPALEADQSMLAEARKLLDADTPGNDGSSRGAVPDDRNTANSKPVQKL